MRYSTITVAVLKELPPTCYILQFKCANVKKTGSWQNRISQNREAPIRTLMGYSTITVAVLKELPPTCYILQFKCANVKKREVDKIGNLSKSGIWQNREFYKIGNLAKSGISQNREALIRILMGYLTITVAVLKELPPTCYILQFKCANVKNR